MSKTTNLDDTEAFETPVYHSPTSKFVPKIDDSTKNDAKEAVELKPRITLFGGVMVVVGCIIGSGIFISPKGVHENAGSVGLSLIIWIICGIFSAIGAYCYAELGTFITKSGGDYAYVSVAFGPFMAFIRLWIECVIVRPCTITAVSMTFALYILYPLFPDCKPPAHAPQLLAAGCIILLSLVNAMSVRLTTVVQNVFTVGKLAALVLIILTGFVLLCVGGKYLETFNDAWTGTKSSPGQIALAFYSGLFAFNGWNYLNFITEELENPIRNLPIAIGISCLICTLVYVFTNVAFYAGVTILEFTDSAAVAVTFANHHYGAMWWIMPIFVAMSCFGTVNGVLLTSSRLFLVAAREDQMPEVLCMINPKLETPIPAVVITGLLSLMYLALSNNIYTLINYVQIVNWLAISCATVGLIYLRYKMPPKRFPRPLQVNLAWPIIFLIGCLFLVIFPMIQVPIDTLIGLLIMFTSVPVYFVFIYWKNKPPFFENAINSFTKVVQKLMLVVPGEKKDI